MEIYCHPVANGTYYFSGACSSTGRTVLPRFPAPGCCPGSSISRCSMLTLPWLWFDFNTSICSLPLPLPRVASATYNIHFILWFPSPSFAPLHVFCVHVLPARWSLKACNVPLPHSTAFFFNTSIYSSFGQLPQKRKNHTKSEKLQRNVCKKVPIHSSTASKTAAHNSHPKSGPILVTNIYATSSEPQPALVPPVLWLPATTAFWSTVYESSLHIGKELSSLNAEKKGLRKLSLPAGWPKVLPGMEKQLKNISKLMHWRRWRWAASIIVVPVKWKKTKGNQWRVLMNFAGGITL